MQLKKVVMSSPSPLLRETTLEDSCLSSSLMVMRRESPEHAAAIKEAVAHSGHAEKESEVASIGHGSTPGNE